MKNQSKSGLFRMHKLSISASRGSQVCELLARNQKLRTELTAERGESGPDKGSPSFLE